jgi:hypothetical protein
MGALTSKPFTFTARSWELSDRLSYDFTDTFFSAIKVSFRGSSVIRILPEFTQFMISEWISDRARFSYDAVSAAGQKSDTLFGVTINSFSVFWVGYFFKRFPDFFNSAVGCHYADLVAAKRLSNLLYFGGSSLRVITTYDFRHYCTDYQKFLSQAASFKYFFLIGFSLRYQLPVLAASFRRLSQQPDSGFFNFGFYTNNLLNEVNLGFRPFDLMSFSRAKSRISRFFFKNIKEAAVITTPQLACLFPAKALGISIFSFFDAPATLSFAEVIGFARAPASKSKLFNLSIPHPFSYTALNLRLFQYQKFESFYSSAVYGNTSVFFNNNSRLLDFSSDFLAFTQENRVAYPYVNFYSHYTDFILSSNSLNILVSLRRHIDSRTSFNYYN